MADLDLDGLTAKILAGIRGSKTTTDDGDDDGGSGRVPRSRLDREIAKVKALNEKFEALQASVTELSTGYESKFAALQAETAEQVKGAALRHHEDLGLVDGGLGDALGRKGLRDAYDMADKGTRGKSPLEFWQSIQSARAAHAEDPEKNAAPNVPRNLVGYLPDMGDTGGGAGSGGKAPPKALGKTPQKGLDSVPTDQGMAAYLNGLKSLDNQ